MGLDAARLHDELLSQMPEGARHDSDICTFCADKAARTQAQASVPSGSEPSDAPASELLPNPEGGTTQEMAEKENETLSRETHEALLAKAVGDASAATEAALARKIEENTELAGQVSTLTAQNAELSADNDRLNKELDTAQVALKVATDEVAALKADNAAKDEAARRAEIAGKRADQVANLGLFPKEYVQEKAARWAEFSFENIVRDGRFRAPSDATLQIGQPVMLDSAKPGFLKPATAAVAPGPNCGVAVFEHIQPRGKDAALNTASDFDTVPSGQYAQMVHGPGSKVWLCNTAARTMYDGRVRAAAGLLAASVTVSSLKPGDGLTPDGSGKFKVAATGASPDPVWLVVEQANSSTGAVEARFTF